MSTGSTFTYRDSMNLSVEPLHRSARTGDRQDSQKKRVLRSFVSGLLIMSISLIATLLLVEGIVRVFFSPAAIQRWSDRPAYYFKPLASETFQDLPYAAEKPEGTYRIAVLGDSFTFATQMQLTDAFPKQLERILRMSQTEDEGAVEVINYGVPGYSTNNEAAMMKRAIKEGADLVILQITLNDPQLKPYAPKGITGKNEFGSYTPAGWVHAVSSFWKTPSFVLQRLHNSETHRAYVDYYFDLFQGSRTKQSFEKAVKLIARRGNRNEVPVIAVVFPLFGIPVNDSYPFLPLHTLIHTLLAKDKIPYLDLFEHYKNIPLSRIQLVPGQDFHPNEIGHRIAAEAIYQWLEQEQHIPESLIVHQKFKRRLDIRPEKNEPVE